MPTEPLDGWRVVRILNLAVSDLTSMGEAEILRKQFEEENSSARFALVHYTFPIDGEIDEIGQATLF